MKDKERQKHFQIKGNKKKKKEKQNVRTNATYAPGLTPFPIKDNIGIIGKTNEGVY